MNKTLVVVLALGLGAWYFLRNKNGAEQVAAYEPVSFQQTPDPLIYAGGTPGFYESQPAQPLPAPAPPAIPHYSTHTYWGHLAYNNDTGQFDKWTPAVPGSTAPVLGESQDEYEYRMRTMLGMGVN